MYVVSGVHLGRGNEHRMSHRWPILSNQKPLFMRFLGVLEGLNLFSRPARSAAPSPLQAKLASADIVQYPIWDRAVYGVPVGLVNTLPRFLIEEILTTHSTHD